MLTHFVDPNDHPLFGSSEDMKPWNGPFIRQLRGGVGNLFRWVASAVLYTIIINGSGPAREGLGWTPDSWRR